MSKRWIMVDENAYDDAVLTMLDRIAKDNKDRTNVDAVIIANLFIAFAARLRTILFDEKTKQH